MAPPLYGAASRWQGIVMGLLDQVISGLTGSSGSASPLQGVLTDLLTGRQRTDGYAQGGMQNQGGLGNLISMFQNAGLGHIAQSWINPGPNQPVSPGQLQEVFGENRVNDMANQAGMPRESFLQQLSHHLPNVVDQITPNGRMPEEGTMSV